MRDHYSLCSSGSRRISPACWPPFEAHHFSVSCLLFLMTATQHRPGVFTSDFFLTTLTRLFGVPRVLHTGTTCRREVHKRIGSMGTMDMGIWFWEISLLRASAGAGEHLTTFFFLISKQLLLALHAFTLLTKKRSLVLGEWQKFCPVEGTRIVRISMNVGRKRWWRWKGRRYSDIDTLPRTQRRLDEDAKEFQADRANI